MSIRSTARKLALHSDSSYRFERGLDPEGVDWASRRCCELILKEAGGELAAGVVDVGRQPQKREPITLRLDQIKRILGIEIDAAEVRRILGALGNQESQGTKDKGPRTITVIPPSWRRDLTREIDLIEEVARIHGYDAIPEDVNVPMASSHRTERDRVLGRVREVLIGAGMDEAMTVSLVDEAASEAFSPWSDAQALKSTTAILRHSDRLRRSLIPSLLEARRNNEAVGNARVELFEIAKVYLPAVGGLPNEELMLGLTSAGDFLGLKGTIEAIVARLNPVSNVEVVDFNHPLFRSGRAVELQLGGERLGFLGEVSSVALKAFELREATTVAEIKIASLEKIAELVPRAVELSPYPAVSRDLNLVVDEAVRWAEISRTVQSAGGSDLEAVEYRDTYRDAQRLARKKESIVYNHVAAERSYVNESRS